MADKEEMKTMEEAPKEAAAKEEEKGNPPEPSAPVEKGGIEEAPAATAPAPTDTAPEAPPAESGAGAADIKKEEAASGDAEDDKKEEKLPKAEEAGNNEALAAATGEDTSKPPAAAADTTTTTIGAILNAPQPQQQLMVPYLPASLAEIYAPPPETLALFHQNPRRSQEENWLSETLLKEIEELPKPIKEKDSRADLENKIQKVFTAIHPAPRPFYSIFQFYQFVQKALEPWEYEVQLDADQTYVHCYLKTDHTMPVSLVDIHFNYPKKTYQTSRSRSQLVANTEERNAYYQQQREAAEKAVAAAEAALKLNEDQTKTGINSRINSKFPMSHSCLGSKTMFDIQWNALYDKLKAYKEKNGDCCVPTRGYEDPQLAKWVSRQREYFNKGTLSQERVDKLNELEFSWRLKDKDTGKGGASEETWNKHYESLKAYKEEHGNTNVPTRGHSDYRLAKWVSRQRECYNKGILSQGRIDKLNELDFSWRLNDKDQRRDARENYAETWMRHFETLKAYKEENGHCNVPTRNYKDPQLSKWVVTQREYYNKRTLPQDRIDKLNSIGFVWRLKDKKVSAATSTVDCDATWKKHFQNLKLYAENHGNTHVPTRGYEDPQLAKWVVRQREYFNKKILSDDRVELLNSIGFTWRLKTKTVSGKRKAAQKESPDEPPMPPLTASITNNNSENATPPTDASNKKQRTTRSAGKVTALLDDVEEGGENNQRGHNDSEAAVLLASMRNPGSSNGSKNRAAPTKSLPTRSVKKG